MKRVLIVSPHFPPDTGAASHRMRLLAPRLAEHGWEPTVVAVDPRDLGARTEPALERFVHGAVRVERVRAYGGGRGRFLGIGDLGLRALKPLERRCLDLLRDEPYHAVLITLPPHYPAVLGPRMRRASGVPYVIDYQDPWVSAWGLTVGGGREGRHDWKSRLSRTLALRFEPRVLREAAGVTAVSEGTLEGLFERHPELRDRPRADVPLGGEPRDFELATQDPRPNPFFDVGDGLLHLVYVGTLLPRGGEVLRAVFASAALLRQRYPSLFSRLRFHFFGTSNQTSGHVSCRVLPLAHEMGLEGVVDERPLRIDYLDALTVLIQAGGILLLGSTERHYTASKVYPALLAGRPLLAVYHEASTVCDVLRSHGTDGATFLATFGDAAGPASVREAVAAALAILLNGGGSGTRKRPDLGECNAAALAGRMASCLSAATGSARPASPRG